MSDAWDDDDETTEAPSLKTVEGRDAWIEFLLSEAEDGEEEEWAQVQVVQEDDDMVARFRWPDGREEVYDLQVRRSMEVVRPAGGAGSN